jgi:Amt family ammonium transporter
MSVEDELRRLQRDTIELQRMLLQSGITPNLANDLRKLDEIAVLRERIERAESRTSELNTAVTTAAAASVTPAPAVQAAENGSILAKITSSTVATNVAWTLLAGFLVMFMQAGFAMVETGLTRAKNAAHTMAMNFLDYGFGVLAFWAVGFGIMFGGVGAISSLGIEQGLDNRLGITIDGKMYSLMGNGAWFVCGDLAPGIFTLFLFQVVFASTANTIPTGTLAERWKLSHMAIHSLFVGGLIYPLFGHWVWGGGWLAALGYIDFAGSTVVHLVGAMLALAGAVIIGPRVGKFNADGTANAIPGHNIPMAVIGTFILAFGWFGFNAGSTLNAEDPRIGLIAVNTALASAAGMAAAAAASVLRFGNCDLSLSCNGMLGGLVAVTASCAFIDTWAAVTIGGIAGVLMIFSVVFVEDFLKLDDPVGAISVHGTCGAFGGLAVGIFANGKHGVSGLVAGNGQQLLIQILGVTTCILFTYVLAWLMFRGCNLVATGAADADQQVDGLDIAELGIEAYPVSEAK